MIIDREYRTLEDIIIEVFQSERDTEDLELGKVKTNVLFTILGNYVDYTTVENWWKNTEIDTLFSTYIYPKYRKMAIGWDNETERDFVLHLANKIRTSYDEYKKLLDLFTSIKDNLLDSIKTQSKFNDTPQTVTTAGVTSYDDTYNSSVTTNYADGATKIARLAEVEAYIKDYYEKWANYVCKGLFIYE